MVTKPSLGSKRVCRKCSAIFYDLCKNPIVCPKCFSSFSESDFTVKNRSSESLKKRSDKKNISALDDTPAPVADVIFDDHILTDDIDSDIDIDIAVDANSSEDEENSN